MRCTRSSVALVLLRVVDADRLEILGEQVAQQLADQALLAIDDRRRPRRLHALPDVGPDRVERLEVADDVFLRAAGRGRADDDAAREAVRLAELPDDAAQAGTLVARLDLARHADVVHRRHEDEEPPRHRDVRGEAGALRAERFLHHLHQDFLPFLQQVLDARLRPSAPSFCLLALASTSPLSLLVLVAAFEAFELLEGVDDFGDIEKPVALEAEVDEGRLHAGQHFRDPALVDVADDAAMTFTLDEDFGDEIVFEDGHHGLVAIGGDDHLLGHSQTPRRVGRVRRVRRSGRSGRPEVRS